MLFLPGKPEPYKRFSACNDQRDNTGKQRIDTQPATREGCRMKAVNSVFERLRVKFYFCHSYLI